MLRSACSLLRASDVLLGGRLSEMRCKGEAALPASTVSVTTACCAQRQPRQKLQLWAQQHCQARGLAQMPRLMLLKERWSLLGSQSLK